MRIRFVIYCLLICISFVAAAQEGDGNRIINSGLEDQELFDWQGSSASVTRVQTNPHLGQWCLYIKDASSDQGQGNSNHFAATPGQYYVQAWVRVDPGFPAKTGKMKSQLDWAYDPSPVPGIVIFDVQYFEGQDNYIYSEFVGQAISADWTRIGGVVTVPDNAATVSLRLQPIGPLCDEPMAGIGPLQGACFADDFYFTTLTKAVEEGRVKKKLIPANLTFEQVDDVPGLPRVLLIGDSISMQYTLRVRELLSDVANVHRPASNCRSTRQTLADLNDYLGQGRWDIILFNWGIHDLTHLNPSGALASPPEGTQQVPLAEYKRNVKKLVDRLKKTKAQLIWASTTPVGPGLGFRFDRDVVAYNKAAAQVMLAEKVEIAEL